MSLPLEFHPAIERDVDQAFRWYRQRRVDLGLDFLRKIDQCLSQIKKNPLRFAITEADIREGQVKRFPYAV